MSGGILFIGGGGFGTKTETADTRIQALLGGFGNMFTHLLNLRVTTQGTAHTAALMRGASRSKATAALAAAGTSLVVADALTDGDGNALAANDHVAVQLDNGEWHLSLVTSWTANTKTIVLTTAIPTGRSVRVGAKVVVYGVAADSFHALYKYTLASGTTNQFPAVAGSVVSLFRASAPGEPILLDIDNATAASTINSVNWGYAKA